MIVYYFQQFMAFRGSDCSMNNTDDSGFLPADCGNAPADQSPDSAMGASHVDAMEALQKSALEIELLFFFSEQGMTRPLARYVSMIAIRDC